MRKVALSAVVIAASAAYVWYEGGRTLDGDVLGSAPASAPQEPLAEPTVPAAISELPKDWSPPPPPTGGVEPQPGALPPTVPPDEQRAGTAAGLPPQAPRSSLEAPAVAPAAVSADVPLPHPRPQARPERATVTPAAMTTTTTTPAYTDGTFTGPVVDAYYGPIQIQAIVKGGRLTAIKVLQYPSDRRTSVYINRQALPLLRDEVIAAQSAQVDVVSGATLTSEAFIRSLDAALRTARA